MTSQDAMGCIWTVVVFLLLLLAPGHCLGWSMDLFGFRTKRQSEQLIWSVALSFAVVPIAAVMIAKYTSAFGGLNIVAWLAVVCAIAMVGRMGRAVRKAQPRIRSLLKLTLLAVGVWVIFVTFGLVDVAVGQHLYMNVTVFDHALRTAFVDAVMRTGVPPANPLYWPGHAAPMRYYYFWYVLTAIAARIAGTTARQAMIASVAWAGFGLVAILGLYSRHFLRDRPRAAPQPGSGRWHLRKWPRELLAVGLLTVTGLDVLTVIAKAIARQPTDADMEWWSPDQVTSWMGSVLWVPHHVAGLVCCLLGFLLVWLAKEKTFRERAACAVLAGISFASGFGLSTWVAVAFALVMMAWVIWVFFWESGSRTRLKVLFGAGLVASVILLPYLAELRGETSGVVTTASRGADAAADGTHLFRFGVRHMIDADALLGVPGFARLAQSHPRLEDALAGLVLLLPGYFVELGFYGLILLLAARSTTRRRSLQIAMDEAERTALMLTIASLVVSSFLRSSVVANNDFGLRSILIAQFFLLLLAVRWSEGGFSGLARPWRAGMIAMLWIGVAGTAYQACVLRFYLPVEEWLGRTRVAGLSEQAMVTRLGFAAMDRRVSTNAVIQFNPDTPTEYALYAKIMQSGRQIAIGLPVCTAAFGGDPSGCAAIQEGVSLLYTRKAPNGGKSGDVGRAPSAAEARVACDTLHVSYLVALETDAPWTDRNSWVWHLPSVVDSPQMRVLDCVPMSGKRE